MITIPDEVHAAARVIERWAAEQDIKSWRIGALASRDELERTAARYDMARKLGTSVYVERWAGWRRQEVTGEDYDRVIDDQIRQDQNKLTVGEIVNLAKTI